MLLEIQEDSLWNFTPKRATTTWLVTTLLSSSSETLLNSLTLFTARRDILKPTDRTLTWLGISGVWVQNLFTRFYSWCLIEEPPMDTDTWTDIALTLTSGLMHKARSPSLNIILRLTKVLKLSLQLKLRPRIQIILVQIFMSILLREDKLHGLGMYN
jgi:hypothetical protein